MREDTPHSSNFLSEIHTCTACSLYLSANKAVPPIWTDTSNNIQLMLIGEGPGEAEDNTGKPFVGAAGKLLQEILLDINLTKNIYVTNIVKHRPPRNRKPLLEEMNTCGDQFIKKEIETTKPTIIVALGRTAAEYLLQIMKAKINGSLRGTKFILQLGDDYSCHVLCTWHPAYILRQEHKKKELVDDLISAKQYIETMGTYNNDRLRKQGAIYGQA